MSSCPQLKTQSEQITRSAAGSLPALSDCTYRSLPHLYLVNPRPGARRKFQKRNSGLPNTICLASFPSLPVSFSKECVWIQKNTDGAAWSLFFQFAQSSWSLLPTQDQLPWYCNPAPFFVETRQLSLSSCIWRKFRPERQGRPLVEAASLAYSGNSPPTSPTASQSLQHLHSHSLPV